MTTLLLKDNDIKSLLINIKNKKDYIQILKDKYRQYKHFVKQENYLHFNDILKVLDQLAIKLNDKKRIDIDKFN